jgi:hypothetical protein
MFAAICDNNCIFLLYYFDIFVFFLTTITLRRLVYIFLTLPTYRQALLCYYDLYDGHDTLWITPEYLQLRASGFTLFMTDLVFGCFLFSCCVDWVNYLLTSMALDIWAFFLRRIF